MTSVTISLPKSLKAELAAAAKSNHRSVSNFFAYVVAPLLEKSGKLTLGAAHNTKNIADKVQNAGQEKEAQAEETLHGHQKRRV